MIDYTPQATNALRKYFGYDSFRGGQARVVNAILNDRDVMAVMPTGAGKSVCYQLPAARHGRLTLVVSPLRALMRDQVQALEARGIPAALIDSGVDPDERHDIYQAAADGGLNLLYVAPERLFTPDFQDFCAHACISLLAVDEAHCVLQWGHDFRSSYLHIGEFIAGLPVRPVVAAFTATATPDQIPQIADSLGLDDPVCVRTGFDRPNIRFACRKMRPSRRAECIAGYAKAHEGSGIVYCGRRDRTEAIAAMLREEGVSAEAFHAKLPDSDKTRIQDGFLDGGIRVICATTAFGMGVDKPDVRWIVNDGACDSLEGFYQEAGRAGRDGKPADSLMLWSDGDLASLRRCIAAKSGTAHGDPAERENAVRAAIARLNAMDRYCQAPSRGRCLRRVLLGYFGDEPEWDRCGNCSVCDPKPGEGDEASGTSGRSRRERASRHAPAPAARALPPADADELMPVVARFVADSKLATGTSYGRRTFALALTGRAGERYVALRDVPGYGALQERCDEGQVLAMILELEKRGVLRTGMDWLTKPGPGIRDMVPGADAPRPRRRDAGTGPGAEPPAPTAPDDGNPGMRANREEMAIDFVAALCGTVGHAFGPAKVADMLAGKSRSGGGVDYTAVPGWGGLGTMDRAGIVAMLKTLVARGRLRINEHRALEPADVPAAPAAAERREDHADDGDGGTQAPATGARPWYEYDPGEEAGQD